jgi:hypothetical protein
MRWGGVGPGWRKGVRGERRGGGGCGNGGVGRRGKALASRLPAGEEGGHEWAVGYKVIRICAELANGRIPDRGARGGHGGRGGTACPWQDRAVAVGVAAALRVGNAACGTPGTRGEVASEGRACRWEGGEWSCIRGGGGG